MEIVSNVFPDFETIKFNIFFSLFNLNLGKRLSSHYKITPYNFEPILAKKVNLDQEIDLGEGIFNLISQIYKKKTK